MALKAYKHLTDGEVTIVEVGSAEEGRLLADVVDGGSYLQLDSDGHAEEIAAAQGTALWTDVSAELGSGGGSAFEHLTEDTENTVLLVDTGYTLGFGDWLNGVDPWGSVETIGFLFDDGSGNRMGGKPTEGIWVGGDSSPASLIRMAANGSLIGAEIADPSAPAANTGALYFKDIGGKTALVARFPTGAVQQIAIEP